MNTIDFNNLLRPMTHKLILICVVCYILDRAIFGGMQNGLEIYSWSTEKFQPWQLITHMFLHASTMHLAFNMLALWMFGNILERRWGSQQFLIFYLLCGIGAAIITQLIDQFVFGRVFYGAMLGASGAVYGILVAFAMLFPNYKLALIFLPIPVAAKYFVPVLLAIELMSGFTGFSIFGGNIAHFAHLGGAFMGFLLVITWLKR